MLNAVVAHGVLTPCDSLAAALGIERDVKVISFVGAGGKSSLIRVLADEAVSAGKTVVVSTTTHIMPDEYTETDCAHALSQIASLRRVTLGRKTDEGKLGNPGDRCLAQAAAESDLLLIEADGSKRLPLKYPASYEPSIDPHTDAVVVVAGLSSLGQPFGQVCQRGQLAGHLSGTEANDPVTAQTIARLLIDGYLQGMSNQRIALRVALNQVDSDRERQAACDIEAIISAGLPEANINVSAHSLLPGTRG